MRHLDKLTISKRVIPAARPRQRADSVDYRRRKLIANIEEQIELIQLALAGKPLKIERKRGHEVVVVHPRIWWTVEPDDKVFTQIRYNKVFLNLGGRGTSIEARSLQQLPEIYRTVIEATKAGELDSALESAARRSTPSA